MLEQQIQNHVCKEIRCTESKPQDAPSEKDLYNAHAKIRDEDKTMADMQSYCYTELKGIGSCVKHKENKCRFSHDIPDSLIQDKEKALAIINKNNLCINGCRQNVDPPLWTPP